MVCRVRRVRRADAKVAGLGVIEVEAGNAGLWVHSAALGELHIENDPIWCNDCSAPTLLKGTK